ESALPTTVPRSEPFRTSTPQTTTPTAPSTCASDAACEDGDPCTDEVCVPGDGCVRRPATGVASVTCMCRRPAPVVCAGQRIPPAVDRRLARVCTSFHGAATKRTSPLPPLRRDGVGLGASRRARPTGPQTGPG